MDDRDTRRAPWPWWVLGGAWFLLLAGVMPGLFLVAAWVALDLAEDHWERKVREPRRLGELPRWRSALADVGEVRLARRAIGFVDSLVALGLAALIVWPEPSRTDIAVASAIVVALALVLVRHHVRPGEVVVRAQGIQVPGYPAVPFEHLDGATSGSGRVTIWLNAAGRDAFAASSHSGVRWWRRRARQEASVQGRLQLPPLRASSAEFASWLGELGRRAHERAGAG